MKNLLSLIGLFAIIVSGCSQDDVLNQFASSNSKKFTASFETNESRTYIEEGKWLRWTKGDQISLFEGNSLNSKYQFDGETGDNAGTFSKMKPSSPVFGTGTDLSSYYAVYPYASSMNITESGVITANLPAEQGYAEKSFGLGANTMVAVTQDTDDYFLKFKNVGGYLKVQLYGDDVTVKSITLKGNKDEKLAGKATITPAYGKDPQISMANDATTAITLNCGEGVKIGASAEAATAFWMVVPPTTFKSGFTITITDIEGNEFTKSTTNEILVKRNDIKPMAAFEVAMQSDNDIPYITFTAENPKGFKMTLAEGISTLQYSVNDGDWQDVVSGSYVTFGGEYGALRLRGNSLLGTGKSRIEFAGGSSDLVSCTGDIRTLLDYTNYATVSTSTATFSQLFCECDELTTAPELPSMELAESCYIGMFRGCTNLVNAPKLPAVTLAKKCYYNMFAGCTKLTTAPEISAITVAEESCVQMFSGCTSLTTVPDFHATELAEWCFNAMFNRCSSLVKAPLLPAQTLAPYCYAVMFVGCTSLSEVTMLATDISAENCLASWVDGVSSTGIFTKASSMNSLTSGASGVPEGWTVVNKN